MYENREDNDYYHKGILDVACNTTEEVNFIIHICKTYNKAVPAKHKPQCYRNRFVNIRHNCGLIMPIHSERKL